MRHVLTILALFAVAAPAVAEEARPDKGWFFYEEERVVAPVKPKDELPVQVSPQPSEKKPMTTAWMRKMIPILQERAYDNPTRENVAAYAYLIRALGDKAQRYTEVHMDLIKTDPFLDMNNNMPFNKGNRDLIIAGAGQKKESAIKHIAKNAAGLFVFIDSKCAFCKPQVTAAKRVAKRHGFDVMFISVDGKDVPGADDWVPDNGTAKKLGITIFPTTVLAYAPATYIPISFGLMSDTQLEEGILSAAKAANKIQKDMLDGTNPFDRGVLTIEDMQDGGYADPEKFVDYVKQKLDKRY